MHESIPLLRRLRYADWPFIQRIYGDRWKVDAGFFDRLYERGLAKRPPTVPRSVVPDLASLGSGGFDPDRLHPQLIDFYVNTKRYRIWQRTVSWERRARALSHVWDVIVRRMGNMMVPTRAATPRRMSSDLYELDLGYGDVGTSWVRGYAGYRDIFYAAGVKAFTWNERTYLSLAFPFRRINLTVVMEAQNVEGDGLRFATDGGGLSGTYVIVPFEERFVALPSAPTIERLTFRVLPSGKIEMHHEDRILTQTMFTIDYDVVPLSESSL